MTRNSRKGNKPTNEMNKKADNSSIDNTEIEKTKVDELLSSLKKRKIDGHELFIVVTQDFKSHEVLMVAFADEEAIRKTLETGKVHYFSTSRKKLWLKGEESGNFQFLRELHIDCDGDVLLVKVDQIGSACHTGERTCFYRKLFQ